MSNIAEKNIDMDFLADDFELVGEEKISQVDKSYASQPYWKDVLSRFIRNKGSIIGIICIVLITFMAIAGVSMNEHTYDSQIIQHQNLAPRMPVIEKTGFFDGSEKVGKVIENKYTDGSIKDGQSLYYWFGTDILGRDIFTLMITGWIGMGRIARAQMLKLKEQEFVLASKTLGAKSFFIIFKEILPNIFGQIITNTMFSIPHAIFTEAFLAFIGLGVPAPMASLGSLISDAFKSFTTHPYMIMPPIIVLAILMLSFNMVADGLRDAFDPRMKEM